MVTFARYFWARLTHPSPEGDGQRTPEQRRRVCSKGWLSNLGFTAPDKFIQSDRYPKPAQCQAKLIRKERWQSSRWCHMINPVLLEFSDTVMHCTGTLSQRLALIGLLDLLDIAFCIDCSMLTRRRASVFAHMANRANDSNLAPLGRLIIVPYSVKFSLRNSTPFTGSLPMYVLKRYQG